MNDDFLRRVRRPPSAAFERQLRERLREQEQNETSRRRPDWRLLTITLLLGGTALATATYFTMSRSPQPSSPTTQQAPIQIAQEPQSEIQNRFDSNGPAPYWNADAQTWTDAPTPSAQQESPTAGARENRQSSTTSSATETSGYVASTGLGSAAMTRPIRVVMSPDIEPFAKDTSPNSRYAQSASFEVNSADAALPTLCEEEEPALQPDLIITSRRARKEEFKRCSNRYRADVLEAPLGHIAIVVTRAKSGTPMQLTTRTLRLALMKQVPAPDNSSQMIDNPYTHWNQIDSSLEERRIEVFGPARNTPEFRVFAVTMLAPACENNGSLDRQMCESVREDGVYTEARLDNTFVGQRLWADPNIVAIVDYRFYAANSTDLLGSLLTGPAPTRESIIDGSYVGARTLRAYVNRARYRDIPKVSSFVNQYLRVPASLNQKVMLPPDGSLESVQSYNSGPKLTEVKLD